MLLDTRQACPQPSIGQPPLHFKPFVLQRRALDLIPATDRAGEPAGWNLGIAATALRDWAEARRAWTAFGIELPGVDDGSPTSVQDCSMRS